LKDPDLTHGINFLKNRSNQLIVDKSNKNDVIKILGNPHVKSISSDDEWIYIERVLTKGKLHKLGRNILKENNILVINFDKYGLINEKIFLIKGDLNKVQFSKKNTKTEMSKKSFAEKLLTSIREKMYGGK
jgi:outer membrane protein assembly factor BamE (lipoprotein component of BamABCDE complex)